MYSKEYISKFDFLKDKEYSYLLDSLTGFISRSNMEEYIKYNIDIKRPFSMYIFDIDNFKRFNDDYGHQYGDKILSEVTKIIGDIVGDNGILGRYGGDEFLLINFKDLSYSEMMSFMKDFQNEFNNRNIIDGKKVTLTTGGVSFPKDATTYEDLFYLTDKCMYRGKSKGRNCFIVYLKELHGYLEPPKSKIRLDTILDDVYRIISTKEVVTFEKTLNEVSTYLEANLAVAKIIYHTIDQTRALFSKDGVLDKKEYYAFNEYFKENGSYKINDIEEYADMFPNLYTNMSKIAKACISRPIRAYGNEYGYILMIDRDRRHIWQESDQVIIYAISHMLGSHFYINDLKKKMK